MGLGDQLSIRKKIVLLGDSAVGKTSLIRRYAFNQFEGSYISTMGTKVTMKDMRIYKEEEEVDLTLILWDIIGREGYQSLHARSFIGVKGALLVADLTRRETLLSLERYWIPLLLKVVEDVPMVFVCNKSDLKGKYEFQPSEMKDMAERYMDIGEGVLPGGFETSYSTSAKEGENVEMAFETLGHLVLTENSYENPVKKICQVLRATGIRRSTDKTTPIGALDEIIVEFCDGFSDSRLAMLILRQEIARAGIDIRSPSKEGLLMFVEYLAEAESEFKEEKIVLSHLKRWSKLVEGIGK
jgi:small GTP-binding protein